MKKDRIFLIFFTILGLASVVTGFYLVANNSKSDTGVSSGNEQPVPNDDSFCGDGIVQIPNSKAFKEECDNKDNNGKVCTAKYKSTCTYCTTECKQQTLFGPFCGDGKLNKETEECDDNNFLNGDGCTKECKLEALGKDEAFCGPIDTNGNNIVDIRDYPEMSKIIGKKCVDKVNYSGCGGKDANQDGIIDSKDVKIFNDKLKSKKC